MIRGLIALHRGSNKAPSSYPSRRAGIADVRPSGSAGDSATARLWTAVFRLVALRACACLGERSEPTCIRQAHATVPKGEINGLTWNIEGYVIISPLMQITEKPKTDLNLTFLLIYDKLFNIS